MTITTNQKINQNQIKANRIFQRMQETSCFQPLRWNNADSHQTAHFLGLDLVDDWRLELGLGADSLPFFVWLDSMQRDIVAGDFCLILSPSIFGGAARAVEKKKCSVGEFDKRFLSRDCPKTCSSDEYKR